MLTRTNGASPPSRAQARVVSAVKYQNARYQAHDKGHRTTKCAFPQTNDDRHREQGRHKKILKKAGGLHAYDKNKQSTDSHDSWGAFRADRYTGFLPLRDSG